MNRTLTLAAIIALHFAAAPCAVAQTSTGDQMVIGTWPFVTNHTEQQYVDEATSLSSMLTTLLSGNTNFKLVSRGAEEIVDKERNENLNPEYIRGKIAQQGRALGATHAMAGILNSMIVDSKAGTVPRLPGMPGGGTTTQTYNANLAFTVLLVDVATGETKDAEDFSVSGHAVDVGTGIVGEAQAIAAANHAARKKLSNWLVTMLPSDFKILKVQQVDKKEQPTEVLVKGGKALGLEKGDELRVVTIEMLEGGIPYETDVAELKVTGPQEQLSVCDVRKGKDKLKVLWDTKAELKILFKPEKDN